MAGGDKWSVGALIDGLHENADMALRPNEAPGEINEQPAVTAETVAVAHGRLTTSPP